MLKRVVISPPAARRPLCVVAMGQGARRKRNWRHNRPNSPYNPAIYDPPAADPPKSSEAADAAPKGLAADGGSGGGAGVGSGASSAAATAAPKNDC